MLFHISGREILLNSMLVMQPLFIQDHPFIKILKLKKLSSKKNYSTLITKFTNKPSPNVYFEKSFPNMIFDWRKIHILPHRTSINTLSNTKLSITLCLWIRSSLFFKWNMLHYVLAATNKKKHGCIFLVNVIYLWQQLATFLKTTWSYSTYTTDCLVWPLERSCKSWWVIANHVLLMFKPHVCKSREKHRLNILNLLNSIKEIKKTE